VDLGGSQGSSALLSHGKVRMNKVDLTRSAMERLDLSRKDAVALIDGVFEDIQEAVMSGEPVKIPGFGQFKVRDRAARMARNPATGEQVKVPAKRVFKFLVAKALKEAVMAKRGARKAAKKTTARPAAKKAASRKAAAPRKAAAKKSSVRKRR
jgi:DNA-binding protein HU-beta